VGAHLECGSENPAGKKFCEDCGAPLENRCPKCAAETTTGKRFCGECGAPLGATVPAGAEPRDGGLTGKRRHLTVLFCDLVGSTEIAGHLDPVGSNNCWIQRGAGSPVAMLLARTGLSVPLPDHTLLFIETRERKR
jgi:predicted amidophosphoribosyltransferase